MSAALRMTNCLPASMLACESAAPAATASAADLRLPDPLEDLLFAAAPCCAGCSAVCLLLLLRLT
jgi:hypothetical protein